MSVNFEQRKCAETDKVNAIINTYIPEVTGQQSTLLDAVRYSMLAGGKRLRPMMISLSYRQFGGQHADAVEPFMAAMEMIHTHSLVHDDLPEMDNDLQRRGKPTTHAVYGQAMGVLTGDALLNLAYETACKAFDSSEKPEHIARALRILTGKTGIYGMIGGQSVDVEYEGQPMTEERLAFIYTLKTGALLESSLMIGAALAGADQEQIDAMERIGRKVGLAFQIQDDILDEIGDEQLLGKPLHSDEKNHKMTYVTIHGIEESEKQVEKLTSAAVEELQKLPGGQEDTFLKELLLSLVGRKS